MSESLDWLVRFGHVLAAAVWVGGYAALALLIVPLLEREPGGTLGRLAATLARALSYAGTATLLFGILLIWRTRGFDDLSGEWGGLVITSAVVAVALLGIGDGALRPALARLSESGDGRAARRWAFVGLALTVLAIGLMTRTLSASS